MRIKTTDWPMHIAAPLAALTALALSVGLPTLTLRVVVVLTPVG